MMRTAIVAVVLCLVGVNAGPAAHLVKSDHWGVNLTTIEIIEALGYPAEIHHTTTDDGYILELHRIPHGVSSTPSNGRVAYLQHPLLGSSADFIMNTPDKAIAYQLADMGYDVWFGNFRGNTYSRNHTSLDPAHVDFWKFSWDEMAYYDLPAMLDYVLAQTGADGVYYTGWSMGTTTFFAMMSDRPEYNQKIKAMAAMGPATYMNHAKGPLKMMAPYSQNMDMVFTMLGIGELLPSTDFKDELMAEFCDIEAATAEICYNFMFLLGGPDADEINKEYLPVIMAHTPAGASVHTVNHYAQLILNGEFNKYDYGYLGNLNHYGQAKPPHFNLDNTTAPVALYWGATDWIAAPEDVARLAANLPNLIVNHRVEKDEFNHLDFGWAIHADQLVYRHIFDFFNKY